VIAENIRYDLGDQAADRRWADAFMPCVRELLAPFLIRTSSFEEDTRRATDLVARSLDVAVRVRRHGIFERFPRDVTFRSKRDNGVETELEKVLSGHGDWLFYGHQLAPGASEIGPWYLLDLAAFRKHYQRGYHSEETNNGDGTWFRAFDVRQLRRHPDALIGSHDQPQPPDRRRTWKIPMLRVPVFVPPGRFTPGGT